FRSYGVLCVVREWGESAKGRTVRVYLDSLASARNVANGGGSVESLSNLTKEIWLASEAAGMSLRAHWIPRDENSFADKLSKRWESWYRLSPASEATVAGFITTAHASDKRLIRLLNVPFNQISNAVASAEADRSRVCIIHPRWTAQSWWPKLESRTTAQLQLGPASAVLSALPHDTIAAPRWILRASIVDFN